MKADIHFLTSDTVAQAAAVEHKTLDTAWSEQQLLNLPEGAVYLIAEAEGIICGICSAYCMTEDAELMNIAVLPAYRRNHIAEDLLSELIRIAGTKQCTRIVLEVASKNENAISLYKKLDFHECGVRRGFYKNDDALLMEKALC